MRRSSLFMGGLVYELKINGEVRSVDVEAETPLLWVLRDSLGLTGTKYSCGVGACGSCTVHVDGKATRSCVAPVSALAGKEITTIEGLGAKEPHPLQLAWLAEQVPQCGYCQPGMLMATAALLAEKPRASDEEIGATLSNICRCGTYPRVLKAVRGLIDASQRKEQAQKEIAEREEAARQAQAQEEAARNAALKKGARK